jgi:hypothetical protein
MLGAAPQSSSRRDYSPLHASGEVGELGLVPEESEFDQERGREIDRAVVEGYRRIPPTQGERAEALASLREAIAEEPW